MKNWQGRNWHDAIHQLFIVIIVQINTPTASIIQIPYSVVKQIQKYVLAHWSEFISKEILQNSNKLIILEISSKNWFPLKIFRFHSFSLNMHFEHNIYQYKKKCVPNFEMFSDPFKLFDMVIWFVFSALFDRWPTMVCWWSLEPAAMNRGEGRWYIPNISALHNRCRSVNGDHFTDGCLFWILS